MTFIQVSLPPLWAFSREFWSLSCCICWVISPILSSNSDCRLCDWVKSDRMLSNCASWNGIHSQWEHSLTVKGTDTILKHCQTNHQHHQINPDLHIKIQILFSDNKTSTSHQHHTNTSTPIPGKIFAAIFKHQKFFWRFDLHPLSHTRAPWSKEMEDRLNMEYVPLTVSFITHTLFASSMCQTNLFLYKFFVVLYDAIVLVQCGPCFSDIDVIFLRRWYSL